MYLKTYRLMTAILLQVTLFLSQHTVPTAAFKCYVCDSKYDFDCLENLPQDGRLQPVECKNITKARYCVKTTNIYAGEHGTKRFCAANDHGNYCKYFKLPSGTLEHRGCVLTCDTESCNGARGLTSRDGYSIKLPIILISLIILTDLTASIATETTILTRSIKL